MSENNLASKVVVAMSGGVDSSVAALLLAREKYDILGVSMQVWDYRQNGGCSSRATCCSPDDFTDARKVAAKIGMPYYVFDFERTFRKEVIDKFVDSYKQGLTPNPCVECNNKVKFRELRDRALAFGCDYVATGHYARIEHNATGPKLLRAVDAEKDQSYFLYGLLPEELSQTLFPVGHLCKSEVREIAKEAGLNTAEKPESQDICFVSGTVQEFLISINVKARIGKIVNSSGQVIGQHDGIHNFTVGQRRGLRLSGNDEPLYVIEVDSSTNTVIVGERSQLERESFLVSDISGINPAFRHCLESGKGRFEAIVQVRSRHRGLAVEVEVLDESSARVHFVNDWAVISPGQAAVFYDLKNEEVLGGGKIAIESNQNIPLVENASNMGILA